jgi:acyl-CoA synthetase (AMP-forming)/AMP-acid ligase II
VNLDLLLTMAADSMPDRVVLGDVGSGLTTAALRRRAARAAVMFLAAGIENVVYFGPNSESVPIALFGAAIAGKSFVPISYRSTPEQLADIAARVEPALVIAGDVEASRLQALGRLRVVTSSDFQAAVATAEDGEDLPFVDPEDVAVVLFTSGTTGKPKAALLRHRHLTSYVLASVEFMGSDESEAQLVSVPPYHVAGVMSVLSALYGGRRLVYLPQFDAADWVATAQGQRITHAMVVPTMLLRILDVVEREGAELPDLRHLATGGGRMPVELIERAMRRLPHVSFVNAYGLTETSSTIALLTPEDHREALASDDPAVRRRLGSVGRPIESVELEIRDLAGEPAPTGGRGEIWVRGEQVAGEYSGAVGREDGWFPTRDAGYLDDAGYLYLDGRLDDVIVRGGENISPGEIEDVLAQHPAVAEAAVVGVPDPAWGEAIAAAVVLRDGANVPTSELQEWVRSRLRSTRMPEQVVFLGELPYNETGKLLRRVLRERLTAS